MNRKINFQGILALVSSSILLTFSFSSLSAIAQSQETFEVAQGVSNWLKCTVKGLKQGQLAVRNEPAGSAIVGLDNGNTVEALVGAGKFIVKNGVVWYMVKVIKGPNSRVNNREGWVNSDYLDCEPPSY